MKVKIIKSESKLFWYSEMIGMEFEVKDHDNTDYEVIGGGYYISKYDCNVLSRIGNININLNELILN